MILQYDDYSCAQLVNRITCLEVELVKAKSTLRDEFAKAAMVPIMHEALTKSFDLPPIKVAQASYSMADAMLEARK